ncbi:branched-chain amino acid ABC transporter permease [Photobacterium gaetbulicola]|uniref:Autoinducer 2 import system permease protein LsrD n=1 Tax=Photobacterium gaetbulicola TaxID=1295392 RepID=A0A0B9H0A3_9GAMM|nr:ABC transporter permease [Photobacterium gaetbulicola]KHT64406.1 branched-chain amino acid ABC transporter permease [Photobacterium gaetbulicola]
MESVNKAVMEPSAKQTRRYLPNWAKSWEALLFLTAVIVFLLNCIASPYFLDPWTLSDATFNFTEKAIIALPLALVIIVREIDISVASIIALCSVAMGYTAQAGAGVAIICVVGLAVGVGCGLFNGLLVTRLNIPSIVVTIGTMSLFRGIAYILLGDQAIRDYPQAFEYFGQGYVFYVFSFEFVVFTLLAVVFYFLLQKTNFGRRTYAIGNNPTAAYYSGINVANHKLILFTLVGFFSAVASIMLTSRLGSTRPTIALGWELNIVTMVVLGGVSILGGSGTIIGVVISVFLMGLVTVGLGLLNIPGIIMSIIIGAMLIGVIALPTLIKFIVAQRCA